MPLYEYKCSGCGKTFEVIQKFSDEPLKTHPDCGGAVERLLSPPALQFKGSGWYVTDYARGNQKPNGSAKSEGSPDAAKSGSGDRKSGSDSASESKSGESKPAADSKGSSTSPTSNTK